jgi:hypothetical protein
MDAVFKTITDYFQNSMITLLTYGFRLFSGKSLFSSSGVKSARIILSLGQGAVMSLLPFGSIYFSYKA